MTLSELATFICGKVNQSEPEDVLACKGFLTRRHDLIWQEALWKDSLVEYRQTLATTGYTITSNWLPAKGVLLLPKIVQRVIAARTAARALNAQRAEFYYRIDYDAFSKTGQAAEYILLPPCVWEFETAQTLAARFSTRSDGAAGVLTFDLLDADGTGVTRGTNLKAAGESADVGTSDRIDSLQKLATADSVAIGPVGTDVITLAAADTNAPKRQRVRLIEIPTTETVIRVLAKRSAPAFSADLDEPAISGMENCLIAFGQADMYERDETDPTAKLTEAMALLDQLKKIETVQQAHNQRIIPQGGYGDDCYAGRADSANPLGW